MTTEPQKRRWYQFSLRAMFILTAVVALTLWLGVRYYQYRLEEDRRQLDEPWIIHYPDK